jgi:hypothetical protein
VATRTDSSVPFRLDHDGTLLELHARRDGLRTRVVLLRDGEPAAQASGLGAVLLPLAADTEEQGPTAVALTALPGVVSRALLLVSSGSCRSRWPASPPRAATRSRHRPVPRPRGWPRSSGRTRGCGRAGTSRWPRRRWRWACSG